MSFTFLLNYIQAHQLFIVVLRSLINAQRICQLDTIRQLFIERLEVHIPIRLNLIIAVIGWNQLDAWLLA